MIQLSSLTKTFGDRVLLDAVSWQIDDRERVGLSGPNGAGKTTLLKMLAGIDEPDGGLIVKPAGLTIGYLPQDGLSYSGRTLREEVSLAFKPLLDMKAEIAALEDRLGDEQASHDEHETMLSRYSELQDEFRRSDGYTIELKVTAVLRGLGFSDSQFTQPTDSLSGGWQMRLALAKLLLGRPTLLLLDEPTNHLDLEARNWLEEYLHAYPFAVILVSHDRFFLDAVVTRIADLTLRQLTDYHTNYSGYLVEHHERIEALRKAKREQDEEVARVKMFIDRFRYQATKASQVQSRIKMLEKVVPIEVPAERKKIHFDFPTCGKSGRTVIEMKAIRKAYGDLTVFDGVGLHIERGDRIALVGPNGAGKSTLMRMLSGEEAPDGGTRTLGHNVVVQYFAQDEATRMDGAPSVYETLTSGSPLHMVPMIRSILGGFLFTGDDVYKHVRVLSGGERTRLAVARMLLRPSNTLILDEPTNHLDLDSKEVLLDALADYGGTLIFVSHDRYFVERLATKIIDIGDGRALVYPGTYKEFLWHRQNPGGHAVQAGSAGQPRPAARAPKAAATKAALPPNVPAKQSHERKKQEDAHARKQQRAAQARRAAIEKLEAQIAECEAAIRELEQTMSAPGFYDDRVAAQPTVNRHQSLMWQVGDLMHQWEQLQAADMPAKA